MIDLHSHTVFSDGELIPAELIQRADAMGHRAIALTDHVDMSSLNWVVPRVRQAVEELARYHRVRALAGCEITHVPPPLIAEMVAQARDLGAQIVVIHGESIVEPVPAGTNLAGIEAGADIMAHPGLLTAEEAALAAERGVHLEISARKGHCLGNGLVAGLARKYQASLVINTDAHAPGDLIDLAQARRVALGAGLDETELAQALANSEALVARALGTSV